MKFSALLIVFALTGAACTERGGSKLEEDTSEILRVGSQEVRLLRSDAPLEDVKQQFRLKSPRDMSNGITQFVTMRDRREVVDLLEAVWRSDKDSYPDFNWQVVDTPTVRLAIAAVLGQWAEDKAQYRSFVQRYLDSADRMTRMDAVIALGSIGDAADIPVLAEYATGSDELLAMSALGTLRSLGTKEAIAVVERVAKDPSMPSARRTEATKMLPATKPSSTND